MSTDLVRIADATGYNRNQVELVKDTIARGASDDELILFLHLAKRTGLDPFSRQIYLIERRTNVNGEWRTSRQPQTGIDGLRLIADRTERYSPGREPSYSYDDDGNLLTATAYVKKWVRGEWHEVAATAHYREYVQTKKDGTPNQMWGDKPHIMLAKCAEALALRRAFPAELSGLYTSDEIRDDATPVVVRPVNTITGEVIDDDPPPAELSGVARAWSSRKLGRGTMTGDETLLALNTVKALADEVRKAGGDPGRLSAGALLALTDEEYDALVRRLSEQHHNLHALAGTPEAAA
jgi:phage recombination protein Bet